MPRSTAIKQTEAKTEQKEAIDENEIVIEKVKKTKSRAKPKPEEIKEEIKETKPEIKEEKKEENKDEEIWRDINVGGMTGQKFKIPIFIGPTYYQRLKHLVSDNMHCLTGSHKVMTERGWRHIYDISKLDKVATLNKKENKVEYHHPIEIHKYENGEEKLLYHIKNKDIDTIVTEGHRMLVDNELVEVRNIIGKKKYRNMYYEFEVDHDKHIKKFTSNQNVYCLTVPNEIFYVKNNNLEF